MGLQLELKEKRCRYCSGSSVRVSIRKLCQADQSYAALAEKLQALQYLGSQASVLKQLGVCEAPSQSLQGSQAIE